MRGSYNRWITLHDCSNPCRRDWSGIFRFKTWATMHRRFLHAVFACALAFGLCSVRAQPMPADDPIVLGLIEGLSGSLANAGEAVHCNLLMDVERVNQRGVMLPQRPRRLELRRFDSKGNAEEALAMLRAALDR